MLAAIETGTITDFVKDHPAEAYGIAGAVILLLILLLLINRRRKKERDGGEEVSPREARQAKKQAKAEAKDAKAEAKADAKGAKAEEAKADAKGAKAEEAEAAPSHDEAETKADAQSGDGGEGKPSRKSRREARKEKRKQIAEEKRQAEEQDRRAWEDERKRRREERRQRKEERALRKAQRKGVAPPEPAKDEEVKAERTEDGEVKAAEPAEAGTTDGEEKSTMLAAALGLGAAEAAKKAGGDGEGKSEEEEKGTKPLEEVPIGTDDESGEEASKEDSPTPTATEKAADAEQEGHRGRAGGRRSRGGGTARFALGSPRRRYFYRGIGADAGRLRAVQRSRRRLVDSIGRPRHSPGRTPNLDSGARRRYGCVRAREKGSRAERLRRRFGGVG